MNTQKPFIKRNKKIENEIKKSETNPVNIKLDYDMDRTQRNIQRYKTNHKWRYYLLSRLLFLRYLPMKYRGTSNVVLFDSKIDTRCFLLGIFRIMKWSYFKIYDEKCNCTR